jgi:hypothetical protein
MDPQKYQTTKIKQNTTQKAKTRSNTDPPRYQTTKIKQHTTQKAKTRSNTDPPRYQTTKIKQHTTQKAKKMNNTDLTKISEVNLGARDVYLLLHALMRTYTGLCLKLGYYFHVEQHVFMGTVVSVSWQC